ncbi:MAG: YgeY family selenium metabolism-linked hydrolase [Myxococcales bacterium]|jgi:putative selenium metabolism hydrolase
MIDQAALIADVQALVRCRSVSGEEAVAVEAFCEMLKRLGYDEVTVDPTGNVVALIRGGRPGERLLFEGHIDTVDAGDRSLWTRDPFGGHLEEGRIYGRGTSDMKGALVAMAHGLASLIPEKERLSGEIALTAVVCEEIFEGVAFGRVLDRLEPDLVVIGEATELELAVGQRGRAEIAIETFGKSAHSSNPEAGVNAVDGFVALFAELRGLELPSHPRVGQAILELVDVVSEPYPGESVLPARCRSTWDRRLIPGETAREVLAPVEEAIARVRERDPRVRARASIVKAEARTHTGAELSAERFFPGWIAPEGAEYVARAQRALASTGLPARVRSFAFCTDGTESAGRRGLPTIGFGPSREDQAHVADEYVEVEQLLGAAAGYAALARAFLGERADR